MEPDLDPREEARNRRRDRDAAAQERALMRSGLAKQFKQVLDSQVRRGREADEALKARKRPKDGPPAKPDSSVG